MRRGQIGFLLALCVAACSHAGEDAAAVVRLRGGVANYCRSSLQARSLERVAARRKIIYFGHHLFYEANFFTSSPRWIMKPVEAAEKKSSFTARVSHYLSSELVPGIEVSRQISTTDAPSWSGAFRILNRGILLRTSGGFPPDTQMVMLDFAYNDRGLSEQTVYAGLEGMIRQIRQTYPEADIVFVYSPNREFVALYRNGRQPDSIRWHEAVADHYRLPSVNLAQFMAEKILASDIEEEDVFLGDHVISDAADQLCLDALKPLFEAGLAAAEASPEVQVPVVPEPLGDYPIDVPKTESYDRASLEPGWLDWQPSPVEHFLHVLRAEASGPALTLRFQGNLLGMTSVVGPDTGDVEVSINGSPWTHVPSDRHRSGGPFREVSVLLAEGLDATAEHELKLRVAPERPAGSTGNVVRIVDFLVNGTVRYEDPYTGMTTLERIDAIYADLEPLTYKPPANRWAHIPRTMRKLQEGPSLTMVLLGDSIMNDTSGSQFELLLGRMYPRCNVKKVTSVRSSTGCDWYKQEGRVDEWVLAHDPDLLIIGGISNRGSDPADAAESVREVVRQVRAARPETEILLMTGPFGLEQDPKRVKGWREFATPDGNDYRSRLMVVAEEERAEFIDMNGIVGRYLLDSQYPCGSFQRDPIHANWRGKQLLGRIIEKYFAPK